MPMLRAGVVRLSRVRLKIFFNQGSSQAGKVSTTTDPAFWTAVRYNLDFLVMSRIYARRAGESSRAKPISPPFSDKPFQENHIQREHPG